MKRILCSLYLVLCPLVLCLAANPGFGDRRYTLTVLGEYSYNTTWSHHGNLDVQALMPFNPHFEMEAKVQTSLANVHTLALQLRPKFGLPVGELFTVGVNTAVKLRRLRINTIGDLAQSPLDMLQSQIGNKLGLQLHNFSNGIDDSPVLAEPEEAKGYSISTTMEEDVTEADAAKRILLALADSVTARMRADGAQASCIAVTIRSNDFRNKSHQRQLDLPTDVTSEAYEIAVGLFTELWDRQTPLRLLGISLTNLIREEDAQMSLFNDGSREKARKLDRAVDAIRGKYGSEAIGRGSAMETSARIGRKYKAQMDPEKDE